MTSPRDMLRNQTERDMVGVSSRRVNGWTQGLTALVTQYPAYVAVQCALPRPHLFDPIVLERECKSPCLLNTETFSPNAKRSDATPMFNISWHRVTLPSLSKDALGLDSSTFPPFVLFDSSVTLMSGLSTCRRDVVQTRIFS